MIFQRCKINGKLLKLIKLKLSKVDNLEREKLFVSLNNYLRKVNIGRKDRYRSREYPSKEFQQ